MKSSESAYIPISLCAEFPIVLPFVVIIPLQALLARKGEPRLCQLLPTSFSDTFCTVRGSNCQYIPTAATEAEVGRENSLLIRFPRDLLLMPLFPMVRIRRGGALWRVMIHPIPSSLDATQLKQKLAPR